MSGRLQAEAVSKAYRQGSLETKVLSEVSLEIAPGETTSLVGVSGSGKSTLISLLAGLMSPDGGRVLFDGQDLNELNDAPRARLRANRIGVALQNSNLIPFLTAVENVQLAIDLGGRGAPSTRAVSSGSVSLIAASTSPVACPGVRPSGWRWRWPWPMSLICSWLMRWWANSIRPQRHGSSMLCSRPSRERGLAVLLVTHSVELAARTENRLRLIDGKVRPL